MMLSACALVRSRLTASLRLAGSGSAPASRLFSSALLRRRCPAAVLLRAPASIPPVLLVRRCPFSSSSSSIVGLEAALRAALRPFAKIPFGFKNFFPKGASVKQEASKASKHGSGNAPKNSSGGGGGSGGGSRGRNRGYQRDNGEPNGGGGGGSSLWGFLESHLPNIILTALAITYFMSSDSNEREISFQEFQTQFLDKGLVDRLVVVNKSLAKVHLRASPMRVAREDGFQAYEEGDEAPAHEVEHDMLAYEGARPAPSTTVTMPPKGTQFYFNIGSVETFERNLLDAQQRAGVPPESYLPVQYVSKTSWMPELMKFGPTLLLIGFWVYAMRGMSSSLGGGAGGGGPGGMRNIFQVGKANPLVVGKSAKVDVSFADVAGLDEAKVEVMEFVKFLKHPERFTKLGARIPKGALLVGPPGTGKTLLAKATAGEASVPFYSISGSDFIEMFVGVGPSRVRDLFAQARKNAPCIVFIDEIDAVGRSRGKGGFSGSNDERENTLNQLLVEMDGFSSKAGVVVLAGTNRADILDKALLRPGRFDRQILIDKPDIRGRQQIFMVHLKPLKLADNADDISRRMSALTPGFSGADIANICNEAALIAARGNQDSVNLRNFEAAADRIIGGLEKKNKVMTKQEKELVAYHEAGHAVLGWFLEHADPLLKVTIVPRGVAALGFAQYLPKELNMYTDAQLSDIICMALGGRAAEQTVFGEVSTGASDDLRRVTQLAYSTVTLYGMSERIGHVSFPPDMANPEFVKPYSEQTAQIIDEEVRNKVANIYARAIQLAEKRKPLIEKLAKRLLQVETVNHDDLVEILGPRPFASPQYLEFLQRKVAKATPDEDVAKADSEPDSEPETDGGGDAPPVLRPV